MEDKQLPVVVQTVQTGTDLVLTEQDMNNRIEVVMIRLRGIEQLKKKVLQSDVDYGRVPGATKDCLFLPGAEKLMAIFDYVRDEDILTTTSEPWKEWEYNVFNKDTREWEKKQARGWYKTRVKVKLYDKRSGLLMGSGIGECSSSERGRETAPENTIIKIAAKRAFMTAIKTTTMSSDLWTIDLDDAVTEDELKHTNGNGTEHDATWVIDFGKHKGEKLGDVDVGYLQSLAEKGKGRYQEIATKEINRRQAANLAPSLPRENVVIDNKVNTLDPAYKQMLEEILTAEKRLNLPTEKLHQLRIKHMGVAHFQSSTNTGMANYWAKLQEHEFHEHSTS